MDIENLPVGTLFYSCKICTFSSLQQEEISDHINNSHTFISDLKAMQSVETLIIEGHSETSPLTSTTQSTAEQKLWVTETTVTLIQLVEEFDSNFQTSVKKVIWMKIAKIINDKFQTNITWQQCDTKWKSLNKTYKEIKTLNNTSGNKRQKWEYFELLDRMLYKKPEITPAATCSSAVGLKTALPKNNTTSTDSLNEPSSSSVESTLARKRKMKINEAERRHREKMEKQERFLKHFEDLVNIIKKNKDENDAKT